jgi:HEAT repeat protein
MKEALTVVARFRKGRAFEIVLTGLKEPDLELRSHAIGLLDGFKNPLALPSLVELLKDPSLSIRAAAKETIDGIRYYLEQKKFAEAMAKTPQAD